MAGVNDDAVPADELDSPFLITARGGDLQDSVPASLGVQPAERQIGSQERIEAAEVGRDALEDL